MSSDFHRRLERILDRLTSDDFLHNRGLGNEIPFYAFDYPPEQELSVRRHLDFLLAQIPKRLPELRLVHLNLLRLLVDIMQARGFYDDALIKQRERGDAALLKALSAPLAPKKVAAALAAQADPANQDLILVSGVGSAWPLLRTHNLLNNLQVPMGHTPLVLFYPGVYDGQSLRLFGHLPDKPYYRAFRLVD
jgi:hypothetical protein